MTLHPRLGGRRPHPLCTGSRELLLLVIIVAVHGWAKTLLLCGRHHARLVSALPDQQLKVTGEAKAGSSGRFQRYSES